MSYDLLVFEPKDAPRERAAFLDWYRVQTQWAEGHSYNDPSQTTGNLSAWYADMRQEFPDINAPDADEVTDSEGNPRVTGYSIGRSVIYADFRWAEAESAYAAVRGLAVKHGVGFFNVSGKAGEIWFPPTGDTPDTTAIPGLVLSLEGQRAFTAPSIALIAAAVDWLQPAGGPGFLLLEKAGEPDFAQAGGGKDACTIEWREYLNKSFRHWVAGLPGADSKKNIKIPGNGTYFTIKANEQLSNKNVKAILLSFAQGKSRPQEFVWRDITAQFGA